MVLMIDHCDDDGSDNCYCSDNSYDDDGSDNNACIYHINLSINYPLGGLS